MSIKYYQLAKDEELPEEFCVVRDVGGEPSEYTFYVPETENAKLRELAHGLIDGYECGRGELCDGCTWDGMSDPREFNCKVRAEARELGIEVSK